MITHIYCLIYDTCSIIHIIIHHNKKITTGYIKYAIKKSELNIDRCFYVSSDKPLPIEDTRPIIEINNNNKK